MRASDVTWSFSDLCGGVLGTKNLKGTEKSRMRLMPGVPTLMIVRWVRFLVLIPFSITTFKVQRGGVGKCTASLIVGWVQPVLGVVLVR